MKAKTCISCKQDKPATGEYFYYRNKAKGYLSSWCKPCRTEQRATKREAENAAQRERRRKHARLCPECGDTPLPKRRRYCDPCLLQRRRAKKHEDKCLYRSRLRKATPKWADKDAIREIYANCPPGHDVDHIIPIRGEKISGLHVPENLQYLTTAENASKGNRWE